MRYSNEELFDVTTKQYNSWLDDNWTPREYFQHCIRVLELNIEDSIKSDDWMETEIEFLRNYRLKSIEFYRKKLGDKK